ncbi:hypothetical protein ACHAWX_000057 [Stephanocyclus meneghinianus]
MRLCQQSFASSSDPSRKNFIMPITDVYLQQQVLTLTGGDNAKSNGTCIIPVSISEYNDVYALICMLLLSSDDEVFDVTCFTSLDTLKDRLIE